MNQRYAILADRTFYTLKVSVISAMSMLMVKILNQSPHKHQQIAQLFA